jgi:gliding motility-associated lipoprotein GldH
MLSLTTLCLFSACSKGVLKEEKWSWKDKQWIQGDRKTMVIEAMDTSTLYQMEVRLKHEESYAFENLYVRTITVFPSGREVTSVVSLELTQDDGSWSGDYGENCCSIEYMLQKQFTFPEVGTYTWSIEPYMRIDTIKGIQSVKVTCREKEK